ncbi:hypothetical protein GCM10029978_068030 [Actinoallomurus acanthiterrae]
MFGYPIVAHDDSEIAAIDRSIFGAISALTAKCSHTSLALFSTAAAESAKSGWITNVLRDPAAQAVMVRSATEPAVRRAEPNYPLRSR